MTRCLGYSQAVGLFGDWLQLPIDDREDQLTLLWLLPMFAWMGAHNVQAFVVIQRLEDSNLGIRIVPVLIWFNWSLQQAGPSCIFEIKIGTQ